MLTVTFDELELNAVLAALDDRLLIQGRALSRHREQRDTPSNAFTIECIQAAIRHATLAKLRLSDAIGEPEFPADMTVERLDSWTPGELVAGWGK